MKKVEGIISPASPHWVGNGFPVRSIFSYHQQAQKLSPFLLLDYAGPMTFQGDGLRRGVGVHPHRGFETVTIVYQGEVEHRDSTGRGGVIGPGDVQWMTAGAGILHEEFHSRVFSETGGVLQMVQLWVNLPASHKIAPAKYQALHGDVIPLVKLPNNAGTVRPIAGEFDGTAGPAHIHSPMQVWDIRLKAGGQTCFHLADGWTGAVVVLEGTVCVNNSQQVTDGQMALLSSANTEVKLHAEKPALVLILSGEPLNEPVIGHGPFVMNSKSEILQAFDDLKHDRFGSL